MGLSSILVVRACGLGHVLGMSLRGSVFLGFGFGCWLKTVLPLVLQSHERL